MDTDTKRELDQIGLRIEQRRGHYAGLDLHSYQALKEREQTIAQNPEMETVSLEEVIEDFKRTGAEETQLLPKAFISDTAEESRRVYRFGYQELVVHFAMGDYAGHNDYQLGLISSHIPGSPGGGGWGSTGIRKLQLAKKPFLNRFNWERWVAGSLAWAIEVQGDRIQYIPKNEGGYDSAVVLKLMVEQERAKK